MRKKSKRNLPTKAIAGFVELAGRNEALNVARDAAKHFFVSTEEATCQVIKYGEGHMYEAHEAGGGKGHLFPAMRLIASGKEFAWFRIYQKIVKVEVRDGKPLCLVLSRNESMEVMQDHPDCEVKPSDKMMPVVAKGEGLMAAGLTFAMCGVAAMALSLGFDVLTRSDRPIVTSIGFDEMPYKQWGLVENTPVGLFVESLRYDATKEPSQRWSVSRRPIPQEGETIEAVPPEGVSGEPQ